MNRSITCLLFSIFFLISLPPSSGKGRSQFRVLAFYTAKNDPAHISYVAEANVWFPKMASKHRFLYSSTTDWSKLNTDTLATVDVVVFLDTRPEDPDQRAAFRKYMESGGAWMGFHFAAFALSPSTFPQDWDWYHQDFLGSDEYRSNTWRPTSAVLKVENRKHPTVKQLPATFTSAPNEWYCWTGDLTSNPNIQILLAIDKSSFPLGTGPKQHEIWRDGYYPVAWTNKSYRMIYINMGHNDMDYGNTNRQLSETFSSESQNQFIVNGLKWLGNKKQIKIK
jgi:uncharacterized protein